MSRVMSRTTTSLSVAASLIPVTWDRRSCGRSRSGGCLGGLGEEARTHTDELLDVLHLVLVLVVFELRPEVLDLAAQVVDLGAQEERDEGRLGQRGLC